MKQEEKEFVLQDPEDNFTLQEKIETVMGMLNTPIFRRRIRSEEAIKLIGEICQEMDIKRGILS